MKWSLALLIIYYRLLFQDKQSIKTITQELSYIYINARFFKLYFLLKKNIINHRDINLISFFNQGIICFIINIYSNNQQNGLKYLKNTEVNFSNILIITRDFNIRDNDWDPSYPHYSVHANPFREIANSFNLELSTPINQIPRRYLDNLNNSNSVIDLMFLWVNSDEIDTHNILPDLWSLSNYTSLIVDIIIIKNSEEEEDFVNKLKNNIGNISIFVWKTH